MPKNRRRRRRWLARSCAWECVELLITLFNFYELHCPMNVHGAIRRLGEYKVTRAQHSYAHDLFERLLPICALRSEEDWTRGRRTVLDATRQLHEARARPGDNQQGPSTFAQPVITSRVSLPEVAAVCDPSDYLTGEQLAAYQNLNDIILPECDWEDPLPKPCLMISWMKKDC